MRPVVFISVWREQCVAQRCSINSGWLQAVLWLPGLLTRWRCHNSYSIQSPENPLSGPSVITSPCGTRHRQLAIAGVELLWMSGEMVRMLMPECPSCHSRLPLSEVFGAGGVICPRCHSELARHGWTTGLPVLLCIWTQNGVAYLVGHLGLSLAVVLTASGFSGLVAGALAHVLLVRYRLKQPPLSILTKQ